jgi:hypothetical protein
LTIETRRHESAAFLISHGTGRGPQFFEGSTLSFKLHSDELKLSSKPVGVTGACFSPSKKPPPQAGNGDGFSQYETTDMSPSMWPVPPSEKKPPLGLRSAAAFRLSARSVTSGKRSQRILTDYD